MVLIMRKKLLLVLIIVCIIATLFIAAIPSKTILARLEIRNRTDQVVKISLNGEGKFYFLTVNPYETTIFTVERAVYSQTTFLCGSSASGVLDMRTNVRLVFPPCNRKSTNTGTPTIEKIHLNDTTSTSTSSYRRYQFE
jgi:hypothetical protein